MIETLTADIFSSPAQCLVNTVNCEGFMGKGLAYRFKLRYPLNNAHYEAACQRGQLHVGHILFFKEGGKTIANFPTKDRWRDASRYEYIEAGLEDLCAQIARRAISSVALPPLGCGNGGLEWPRVKAIIERHMATLDAHVYLHTPLTLPAASVPSASCKLGVPHLVLMRIKGKLSPFSRSRLKAAALLVQLVCSKSPFDFAQMNAHAFGCHIDTLCRQIRAFQQNGGVDSRQADVVLSGNLASVTLDATLARCATAVDKATHLVNSLLSERDLEVASAVLQCTKECPDVASEEVCRVLCPRFESEEVCAMIICLEQVGILERTLLGFRIATA